MDKIERQAKLIIIPGAPKSGTSSVLEGIAMSTSCYGNGRREYCKEPGFLLSSIDTDFQMRRSLIKKQEYLSAILSSNGVCFDASQSYFTCDLDQKKVGELKNAFKEVNLLFLLREPYSRICSAYRMDRQNGWVSEPVETYLEKELRGERNAYGGGPRYIEESMYFHNVNRLLQLITPNKFEILLTEQLQCLRAINHALQRLGFSGEIRQMPTVNQSTHLVRPNWLTWVSEKVPVKMRKVVSATTYWGQIKKKAYGKEFHMSDICKVPNLPVLDEDLTKMRALLSPQQVEITANWYV